MSGNDTTRLRPFPVEPVQPSPPEQPRAISPPPVPETLLLVRTEPAHRLSLDVPPGTVVGTGPDGVFVACAPGVLRLVTVRPEGRGDLAAAEWARGARLQIGDRLTVEKEAHA